MMKHSPIKRYGIGNLLMIIALWCAATLTMLSKLAHAQTAEPIAVQVEDLKKELIKLNRDLFILEEDLLFPSSTQVAVYLKMDVGEYFRLDAVELKLDNKTVIHQLYTERQVSALHRGGVQRLFIGNLSQGKHEISAFFVGIGPEQREYKRAVALEFEKDSDARALELEIRDSTRKQQPEFSARVL